MSEFLAGFFGVFILIVQELLNVDWTGLIAAAVASGVGITLVTQILKAKWIKVPAKKYPRGIAAMLSWIVGVFGAVAVGIDLSSITSVIVFAIVSFVVSGISYDAIKGLVKESSEDDSPIAPKS